LDCHPWGGRAQFQSAQRQGPFCRRQQNPEVGARCQYPFESQPAAPCSGLLVVPRSGRRTHTRSTIIPVGGKRAKALMSQPYGLSGEVSVRFCTAIGLLRRCARQRGV